MTWPDPICPLGHRDRAVVESRDDAVVRPVLAFLVAGRLGFLRHGAIAEESRGRQVSASRSFEELEHRVAGVELGERAAAARAIDDVARHRGKNIVRVGAPVGSLTKHGEQAAALRYEALQHVAGAQRGHVVEDDDPMAIEIWCSATDSP